MAKVSFIVAMPLAGMTSRMDLPGRTAWTSLATLPLVIPSYVGAYALVAMVGPRAIVQGSLEPMGVDRLPSIYGLAGAVWALTLFTYPFLLLSIRAGLRNLERRVYPSCLRPLTLDVEFAKFSILRP